MKPTFLFWTVGKWVPFTGKESQGKNFGDNVQNSVLSLFSVKWYEARQVDRKKWGAAAPGKADLEMDLCGHRHSDTDARPWAETPHGKWEGEKFQHQASGWGGVDRTAQEPSCRWSGRKLEEGRVLEVKWRKYFLKGKVGSDCVGLGLSAFFFCSS